MIITQDHLTLLKELCSNMELDENFETVPQFNPRRPYGNSNWINNIGEMLGIEPTLLVDEDADGTKYYDYTQEDEERFTKLQRELVCVLRQIVTEYKIT